MKVILNLVLETFFEICIPQLEICLEDLTEEPRAIIAESSPLQLTLASIEVFILFLTEKMKRKKL